MEMRLLRSDELVIQLIIKNSTQNEEELSSIDHTLLSFGTSRRRKKKIFRRGIYIHWPIHSLIKQKRNGTASAANSTDP